MSQKRKGLGRGLEALLGGDEAPQDTLTALPVARIRPGRYQPRTRMDQEALAELASSIKSQGLMQPVLVRVADMKSHWANQPTPTVSVKQHRSAGPASIRL